MKRENNQNWERHENIIWHEDARGFDDWKSKVEKGVSDKGLGVLVK